MFTCWPGGLGQPPIDGSLPWYPELLVSMRGSRQYCFQHQGRLERDPAWKLPPSVKHPALASTAPIQTHSEISPCVILQTCVCCTTSLLQPGDGRDRRPVCIRQPVTARGPTAPTGRPPGTACPPALSQRFPFDWLGLANAGGKCVHKSTGVFCSSRVAYAAGDPPRSAANGGAFPARRRETCVGL